MTCYHVSTPDLVMLFRWNTSRFVCVSMFAAVHCTAQIHAVHVDLEKLLFHIFPLSIALSVNLDCVL